MKSAASFHSRWSVAFKKTEGKCCCAFAWLRSFDHLPVRSFGHHGGLRLVCWATSWLCRGQYLLLPSTVSISPDVVVWPWMPMQLCEGISRLCSVAPPHPRTSKYDPLRIF